MIPLGYLQRRVLAALACQSDEGELILKRLKALVFGFDDVHGPRGWRQVPRCSWRLACSLNRALGALKRRGLVAETTWSPPTATGAARRRGIRIFTLTPAGLEAYRGFAGKEAA